MTGGGALDLSSSSLSSGSDAALATLTVSASVLDADPVLKLVSCCLASPLQLEVVTSKKKGPDLQLKTSSSSRGVGILEQRNAILRAISGVTLHHAVDLSHGLLGGHSTSRAIPSSAMALSSLMQWMAVADTLRRSSSTLPSVLGQLETYLADRAFLIPSSVPTLCDMDLCVAVITSMTKETTDGGAASPPPPMTPHVQRWMEATHARMMVLSSLVEEHKKTRRTPIKIPSLPFSPAPMAMPLFFYGTEDEVVPFGKDNKTSENVATDTAKQQRGGASGGGAAPAAATTTKVGGAAAAAAPTAGGGLTEEQKKAAAEKRAKKNAEKASKKAAAAPPPAAAADALDISALDIRVGKIVKAWHHPEAEKLFCEEVDLGEAKPRQIASGLRPFYETSDLQDRRVLVLCNLKSRNLVGFPSHGMVLCAGNADHTKVEFVVPPDDVPLGERIVFEGIDHASRPPEPENKVAKKKMVEKLAPDLKTDADGVVVWKDHKSTTSVGKPVRALNGMADAQVS